MSDEEIRRAVAQSAVAQRLAKQAQERIDQIMIDLPALITRAVEQAMKNTPQVSEEEREFLSLAVESQAQRVKLRQAIIEKTVPALIWGAITGAFLFLKAVFEEWLKAKGLKLW